jgi:hypothetical protein
MRPGYLSVEKLPQELGAGCALLVEHDPTMQDFPLKIREAVI